MAPNLSLARRRIFSGPLVTMLQSLFRTPRPPEPLTPPSRTDPAVEEARRRALVAESKTRGPGADYLTGGSTLGAAPVAQKYLTGT